MIPPILSDASPRRRLERSASERATSLDNLTRAASQAAANACPTSGYALDKGTYLRVLGEQPGCQAFAPIHGEFRDQTVGLRQGIRPPRDLEAITLYPRAHPGEPKLLRFDRGHENHSRTLQLKSIQKIDQEGIGRVRVKQPSRPSCTTQGVQTPAGGRRQETARTIVDTS